MRAHHTRQRSRQSPAIRARTLGVLVLAFAPSVAGCLTTPNNHQQVCGANANVTFAGYLPWANHGVVFQVATSAAGPWSQFGSATSAASGYSVGGLTHYPFSKSLQIPTWTSSGATLHAYVRARTNAGQSGDQLWQNLTTFEVTPPVGGTATACVANRVSNGSNLNDAVAYCASPSSPVVDLTAPSASTCPCSNTVRNGDLTIDGPIVAAQFVCLQTLNGSLTVTEGAPEVLPLTALQTISGNATLDYSYPFPSMGTTAHRRRTIDLSALTSIGGDVQLTAIRSQGNKAVPLGLHAVNSVGGDITITLRDANPGVFSGLTSHAGNITIQGYVDGQLDVNAGASFSNLTHVTGNVLVQRFFATNGMFLGLQSVDGDVTVGGLRFYPDQSFPLLESVSGHLRFEAMKEFGPTWPALTTVGGELAVVGQLTTTALAGLPVGAISAGAFRLENNAALTDLSGTSFHVGSGDIIITGNTSLSQCTVNTFLAAQQAAGWIGSAIVSGTLPCP